MSVAIMAKVWALRGLTSTDKNVLMALADHAHADGSKSYPGVDRLAYYAEKEPRSIKRILRKLEGMGLIVPTAHQEGGRGHATEYQVTPEAGPTLSFDEWKAARKGDTGDTDSVETTEIAVSERVTPVVTKGDAGQPERVTLGVANGGADDTPTIRPSENLPDPCGSTLAAGWKCSNQVPCWLHPVILPEAFNTTERVTIKGKSRWPLWEAVEIVTRSKAETKAERGRWGKALKDLVEAGATPADVFDRAREYRRRYSTTLTPTALSANWGSLADSTAASGPVGRTLAAVRAAAQAAEDATT